MGYLDNLTVSKRIIPVPNARRKIETLDYRREKLIAHVEEQIELANLALEEKPLQLQRKRGHKVVNVRPRLWWQVDPDGNVLTQIRYNKVPLVIAGRGSSIEVGSLKKLPATFRTVIKAIKAGELDRPIQSACRKSQP